MPEHVHLLISEPNAGTPSIVMQVLKQRVSRALRKRPKNVSSAQMRLWNDEPLSKYPRFWQRRFYDFNVWSFRKKNEKLNYMHFNPVRRGLVEQSEIMAVEPLSSLHDRRAGTVSAKSRMETRNSAADEAPRAHACTPRRAAPQAFTQETQLTCCASLSAAPSSCLEQRKSADTQSRIITWVFECHAVRGATRG